MTTETITDNRPLWFIDNRARVHLEGRDTGGAFDLVESEARGGNMPPLHVHRDTDETFYVLEGRMSFHLPGRTVEAGSGEAFLAPRGIPHAFRVESDHARWLVIGSPAGFADFVREVSDEAEGDGLPPLDREPDVARIAEAGSRHGIELLGPPGTLPG
jgi:mannose-6-phosphate isomerase-like protein (cupin superfamily)